MNQSSMFKDITKLVEFASSFYKNDSSSTLIEPLEEWAALTFPFEDGHQPQSYFAVDVSYVKALIHLDQKVDLINGIYVWARRESGPIDEAFLNALARNNKPRSSLILPIDFQHA